MNNFKEVNKKLSENVNSFNHLKFKSWNNRINNFSTNRAKFCNALKNDGYKTYTSGNYITATKGSEVNTFYFTSHASNRTNYLLPTILTNEVQYFAFYNESKNCVYKVGYGKVRAYCKDLTNVYVFGNTTKLFVPDSWAKEQVINTYLL